MAPLGAGPTWRFDLGNALLVDVARGSLQSVSDDLLFAGSYALALETAPDVWEIIQFGIARVISAGRWQMTRLLRGQSGTEDAMASMFPMGDRIVFLGGTLVSLPVTESELGMPWNWRIGPMDRAAGDSLDLLLTFTPQGRGLRPWSPARFTLIPSEPVLRSRTVAF